MTSREPRPAAVEEGTGYEFKGWTFYTRMAQPF